MPADDFSDGLVRELSVRSASVFKGSIPATFATQVAERFSKDTGLKLQQIGPPIRNPVPLQSIFALVNVDERIQERAATLRLTSQLQNFPDLRPTLGKPPGSENS